MSYDPTTNLGKVRLKIGDNTSPFHFTDDEIQVFLTEQGSILLAAAAALRSWAAAYSTNPSQEGIGGYSYSQNVVDKMVKLAEQYEQEVASQPATTWAEMDLAS